MERIISNETIESIINTWLPITDKFQKCSFILPSGKFIKLEEHYEVYRALLVKQLVQCIPDAEQLLSELGYLRFSYIGYLILPELNLTDNQYKSLELTLTEISKYRDEISIQLYENPKFYLNYKLNDIPNIIKKIKLYYSSKTLLP
jgi:hypothetical protein